VVLANRRVVANRSPEMTISIGAQAPVVIKVYCAYFNPLTKPAKVELNFCDCS